MTQNKKIAITGGIGSGKSEAASILKALGYPVFSSDELYSELLKTKEFLSLLKERFPSCVEGDFLDRKALSSLVFSDRKALEDLNSLAHPKVYRMLEERMAPYPLSFAEIPLLFESGKCENFDKVLVIFREKNERVKAVEMRSGLNREEILKRMDAQFSYSFLPANCIRIENDGSLSALKEKILKILPDL